MKIKLLLLVCGLCLSLSSYSQSFYLYGDKTFGGNEDDEWGYIIQTNHLCIIGHSKSNISGDKTDSLCILNGLSILNDYWALGIDTAFNILWQNDFGGSHNEQLPFLYKASNFDLYFSGTSSSDSSCDKSKDSRGSTDYWFGKIDTLGNLIWENSYGSPLPDIGPKIIQTDNGDLFLVGESPSAVGGDKTVLGFGNKDYWIIKTDSLGNKIWDKVYGGSAAENANIHYFDIIPVDSTNILVAGNTGSPISGLVTDSSRGSADIWLFKLDSAGNIIWQKRIGSNQDDLAKKIIKTTDNNYILAGFTESLPGGEITAPGLGGWDFLVIKLDTSGNILWNRRYGSIGEDAAMWIENDGKGGYWVAGTTRSGIGDDVTEAPYGTIDYWIINIDSLGNKIWDKRFGGPGKNNLTNFTILADSSIMLFGYADTGVSAVKTDFGEGGTDYWLVHFKYGNSPVGLEENGENFGTISIYPNPSNGTITISSPVNFAASEFIIYDISGKTIGKYPLSDHSSTINIDQIAPAMYFYEVRNIKNERRFGKVVIY